MDKREAHVPVPPRTAAELSYYHRIREAEIAKARRKNPTVVVPDALLICERAGQLHAYKRSFVDKVMARVSTKLGRKFTNHTLRRTFGRLLWLAGVPLKTIKEILGHEDTKTTILHLGLNMDDKADAMSKLADYTDALKGAKTTEPVFEWTERIFNRKFVLSYSIRQLPSSSRYLRSAAFV